MACLQRNYGCGLRLLRTSNSVYLSPVSLRCVPCGISLCQSRNELPRTGSISPRCQFFFNQAGFSNKTKEYAGKTLVGFSMEQIFEVVSDVGNYKTFVPFCKRSVIVDKKPDHLQAELSIGFPPIHESYVSSVTLVHPTLVKAECTQGTLFDHLTTTWKMFPGLRNQPQTCVIDFYVSFQFKSSLHSQLAHVFFNELVRQMESAFFTEARRRFGTPSIRSVKLETSTKAQ